MTTRPSKTPWGVVYRRPQGKPRDPPRYYVVDAEGDVVVEGRDGAEGRKDVETIVEAVNSIEALRAPLRARVAELEMAEMVRNE